MALFIFLLIGLYGWIEFEALIWIGGHIGGLMSFIGIFLTAFIGASLLKSQSAYIIGNIQKSIFTGQGKVASNLASGVSILVGAGLMLLPGYVTDAIGLCCFIPGLRTLIGQFILSRTGRGRFFDIGSRFHSKQAQNPGFSADPDDHIFTSSHNSSRQSRSVSDDVIEGDYEDKSQNKP